LVPELQIGVNIGGVDCSFPLKQRVHEADAYMAKLTYI
jgi:hypothetical protein